MLGMLGMLGMRGMLGKPGIKQPRYGFFLFLRMLI
jgi:hypothetical protein